MRRWPEWGLGREEERVGEEEGSLVWEGGDRDAVECRLIAGRDPRRG